MTEIHGGTGRTLDLFGRRMGLPNRARLAAIACWIMAADGLWISGLSAFTFFGETVPAWTQVDRTWNGLDLFGAFAASAGVCVALILLGFANLALRDINTWPLRCAVVLGILAAVSMLVGNVLMLTGGDIEWTAWGGPPSVAFFWSEFRPWRADMPWHLVAIFSSMGVVVCGMIYVFQLAGWLCACALATASIIALAAMFVIMAAWLASMANHYERYTGHPILSWKKEELFVSVVSVAQISVAVLATAYFTVLAIQLERAFRRLRKSA